MKKSLKSKDYTKKLLQNCKSWGCPCTTVKELQQIHKEKGDQDVLIVKTELAYYACAHKADKIARPDLFRLNGISHEEKLTNFAILLSDDCTSSHTVADLPTNEHVITALEGLTEQPQSSVPAPLKLNELCVDVWPNCDAGYEWYIGYIKSVTADGYVVDHLHHVTKGCLNNWKHLSHEEVHTAENYQIVNGVVEGEWNITPDT